MASKTFLEFTIHNISSRQPLDIMDPFHDMHQSAFTITCQQLYKYWDSYKDDYNMLLSLSTY